jgi:hypothetical protein
MESDSPKIQSRPEDYAKDLGRKFTEVFCRNDDLHRIEIELGMLAREPFYLLNELLMVQMASGGGNNPNAPFRRLTEWIDKQANDPDSFYNRERLESAFGEVRNPSWMPFATFKD